MLRRLREVQEVPPPPPPPVSDQPMKSPKIVYNLNPGPKAMIGSSCNTSLLPPALVASQAAPSESVIQISSKLADPAPLKPADPSKLSVPRDPNRLINIKARSRWVAATIKVFIRYLFLIEAK